MAKKQKTSWFAVFVSVILLIGMFAVAVYYIDQETQVIVASESDEYGKLELIPTVSTGENGSIDMKLRYITIQKNVNVFDHVFEHEEIAISDQNHTALYFLERVNATNNTHVYQISKIENATFIRILVMADSTFENLTTPANVIVQDTDGRYSAQVQASGSEVYLNLTKIEVDDEI